MFVRVKKIKGKEYAYVSENRYKKGKVKQRTKKYLGRVVKLNVANEIEFNYDLGSLGKEGILRAAVEYELLRHGFVKNGSKLENDGFEFDLDSFKLKSKKKKTSFALAMNNGYFSDFTVSRILDFKPKNDEMDGYRLAKLFVEAGLSPRKEVFVEYYGRLG